MLRSRAGPGQKASYFLACTSGARGCRTFPLPCTAASVTSNPCPSCGPELFRVLFRFDRGQAPLHMLPEYESCLNCDAELAEALHFDAVLSRPAREPHFQQQPRRQFPPAGPGPVGTAGRYGFGAERARGGKAGRGRGSAYSAVKSERKFSAGRGAARGRKKRGR